MRKNFISLQMRIFFLIIIIIFISIAVETFFLKKFIEEYIIASEGDKVLAIANAIAEDPRIIDAFQLSDPTSVIQPIAEKMRKKTNTSFIVVFNMHAVRYSHPNTERIGEQFVGGDEADSLEGKTYISLARGTLGVSQRAFVPILDQNEIQIGVVSVGLLLTKLTEQKRKVRYILYLAALFSIIIGLTGGLFLSKSIKKSIFGLEPHQIAELLEERNAILSSIKEGIVAIDREGQLILINNNARQLLSCEDMNEKPLISDIIPETKLPLVIETGKEILNEEQIINNKTILVNRIPMFSNGSVIGAVASFRDMSEIRKMADELTEVKTYIDALRAQHHEFLNKLHVISGLLQLNKFQKATDFIVDIMAKKQEISDFLLKNIKEPSLSGLILAKINKANENGIKVTISPNSCFPLVQPEIVNSLITIIGNILENSIEALQKITGKDKEIILNFSEKEDVMEIRIKDNGEGILDSCKDKLFEYGFSTKDSTHKRGIGLYLVKKQVELLSGKMEINSEKGVEFFIILPKKMLLYK
ncbi:MAG: DcuS/MalK family sensor histidine kinase [Spirochaetes bacterium]|nr:DcuS/MalK family sensor histidine kinase [Spirochaetota bacterium]